MGMTQEKDGFDELNPYFTPTLILPLNGEGEMYVQDMNLNKLYYKKMGNVKYISL